MPASSPSIAIVIVTYNSRLEIGGCLESVIGHTGTADSTITIVDNASTDDTAALVRSRWPEVRVIEAGVNLGFSRANNIGARATASDAVLFLNPDTVVRPAAIPTLVSSLASDPQLAIVGPRLMSPDGSPEVSWGPEISVLGEFRQKRLISAYDRRDPVIVQKVAELSRHDREVDWVSGACMLVRRTDLEAVGFFDERYFMYTEDVDLCAAVRRRGRRVRYIAGAEVLHLRGRSARQNPETERQRRRSQLAYYSKHHPLWVPVVRAYLTLTGKAVRDRQDH